MTNAGMASTNRTGAQAALEELAGPRPAEAAGRGRRRPPLLLLLLLLLGAAAAAAGWLPRPGGAAWLSAADVHV